MNPFGMRVIVSAMAPEYIEVLAADWEDRLAAMCSHHIALDALSLHDVEPGGFVMLGDTIVCHPANYERLTTAFSVRADGGRSDG